MSPPDPRLTSPLVLDSAGNPVEPQHAPSSWFGGPIVRFDGLAADAPPRSMRARIRVLDNPLLRLLFYVVAVAVCSLLGGIVLALFFPASLNGMSAGSVVLQIIVTVVAYLLVAALIERRRPPVELAPRRALGLVWGLLGGAVAFGVVYLLITAFGGLRFEGAATVDWSAWWLRVLVTGAGAGIAEEIIFRGIIYRILEEFTGTWVAAALSGMLFGLAHISNPDATWWGAVAIGLEAGVLFGVLYAFTRSLWIVIGFHAAWNLIQGPILGAIVSGTGSAPSLFHTTAHGPDLISGGAFGPEASVIAVGFLLIVTAILCWLLVKHRAVVAPMWIRRARQRSTLT